MTGIITIVCDLSMQKKKNSSEINDRNNCCGK